MTRKAYATGTLHTNAVTPRPTADAWCVYEVDGTNPPILMDGFGVSSVVRVGTPNTAGAHRIFFSNPERFQSGSYVALVQSYVPNSTTSNPLITNAYGRILVQGTTLSASNYLATGASASCDLVNTGFDISQIDSGFGIDTLNNVKARVCAAFFCLRSDSDLNKPVIQNYFTYSEDFSNANWTKSSIPTGRFFLNPSVVAPNGTVGNVWEYVADTINNYVSQSTSSFNGVTGTFSLHAKAGSGETFEMIIGGVGNNFGSVINLRTGAITSGASSARHTSKVDRLADGWFRCSMSFRTAYEPGQDSPVPLFRPVLGASTVEKSVYVWGAQLEQGTVPTAYIKTTNVGGIVGNQDQLLNYQPGVRGQGQKSVQNLFTHSENFADASWAKTRLGVTGTNGGFTAPDGTTTAYKLYEGATTSYKTMRKGTIGGSSAGIAPHVFSIYAKAAERRYATLNEFGYGSFGRLVIDLENGEVTQNTYGIQVQTVPVGDGWWRIIAPVYNTAVPVTNTASFGISPCDGATTSSEYGPQYLGVSYDAGNGYGIYVWGGQLERGTIYGDYVKTTSSAVGSGFTRVTGVTHPSSAPRLPSAREATAWGTIVIPPARTPQTGTASEQPPVYLENHWGVDSVSCFGDDRGWAYDVKFTTPMDNSWYCVITSNEQEPLIETETLSGPGTIPMSEEFSLNMVELGPKSTPIVLSNELSSRSHFRIRTRRQTDRAIGGVVAATDTTENSVAAGDATYKTLYTYTYTGALTADLVFRWNSLITSGTHRYNLRVRRSRNNASTVTMPLAGIDSPTDAQLHYRFLRDPAFSQNNAPHEYRAMKFYVLGAQTGDVYTVEAVAADTNGVVATGGTSQTLKLKDFRVNGASGIFESIYTHSGANRTQRIHFMVFGGRSRYGTA